MPGVLAIAKGVVPVVVALAGAGAFLVPASSHALAHASAVWIDAPLGGSVLQVGANTIQAHASAKAGVKTLDLLVDGHQVSSVQPTTEAGLLVYAQFSWTAAQGAHTLRVQDPATGAAAQIDVRVGTSATPSVAASTTPATTSTSPAPSTSSATTPSSSPPTTQTAPPPSTSSRPTPTPTPTPTTSTSRPPAPPVITSAVLSPTSTSWYCGPEVTLTAVVSNATSVTMTIDATTIALAHAGSTWTKAFNGLDFGTDAERDEEHTYPVTVTATGPGGTVQHSAGSLDVITCKP